MHWPHLWRHAAYARLILSRGELATRLILSRGVRRAKMWLGCIGVLLLSLSVYMKATVYIRSDRGSVARIARALVARSRASRREGPGPGPGGVRSRSSAARLRPPLVSPVKLSDCQRREHPRPRPWAVRTRPKRPHIRFEIICPRGLRHTCVTKRASSRFKTQAYHEVRGYNVRFDHGSGSGRPPHRRY